MSRRRTQLDLPLHARPTWGGRRVRAGRKPRGDRPEQRHGSREVFRRLPAHVTLRLRSGLPSLRSVPIVREIERTFRAARARPGFRFVHYSLQGNHAHLIVEAVDRDALGRGMMALGARMARAVNRITRHSGPVLVDRYHSRVLRTARECHHALRYVLLNTRRHAAKLGGALAAPFRVDPASSARWFDGWKPGNLVTERAGEMSPLASPVARPQDMAPALRLASPWAARPGRRPGPALTRLTVRAARAVDAHAAH
jgi:REP element-mobilizing transposase RayT